jgi:hypothetical protein
MGQTSRVRKVEVNEQTMWAYPHGVKLNPHLYVRVALSGRPSGSQRINSGRGDGDRDRCPSEPGAGRTPGARASCRPCAGPASVAGASDRLPRTAWRPTAVHHACPKRGPGRTPSLVLPDRTAPSGETSAMEMRTPPPARCERGRRRSRAFRPRRSASGCPIDRRCGAAAERPRRRARGAAHAVSSARARSSRQFAVAVASNARITVTLICPGNVISSEIWLAISDVISTTATSSISRSRT